MALSTVVSGARPQHRAAMLGNGSPYPGALALDWANAVFSTVSASSKVSGVFDSNNDRIVYVAVGGSTAVNACIAIQVEVSPVALQGASFFLPTGAVVPFYIPAGMQIAFIQQVGISHNIFMVPALLTGN